jgi:virginiamycin A acetyltransferase
MPFGPDPGAKFPNERLKTVCYIKNIVKSKNIVIGDYTYYSDPVDPTGFESRVTHHYDFMGDKLVIGKFCAIAKGVEFVMNGANHRMNAVTTYPFSLFANGWEKCTPEISDLPYKGDTVIGNDVWIGQNATIMPGVHIGDGAVIAANATVAKDVPPYCIAGGNPAKVIRKRFDDETVGFLLELKWWDWPAEKIFHHLELLSSADIGKLREIK